MTASGSDDRQAHDYVLKFVFVGDAPKEDLLEAMTDGSTDTFYPSNCSNVHYKTLSLVVDSRRVKLKLWDAPAQGRLQNICRHHAKGVHGILLLYDITKRWSFDALSSWLAEVERVTPGVPRLVVGNRLHLAFERRVPEAEAESFARRHGLDLVEVSSMAPASLLDCLARLCKLSIYQNAISRGRTVHGRRTTASLFELSALEIMRHCSRYSVTHLPVPHRLKDAVVTMSTSMTSAVHSSGQRSLVRRQMAAAKGRTAQRSMSSTNASGVSSQHSRAPSATILETVSESVVGATSDYAPTTAGSSKTSTVTSLASSGVDTSRNGGTLMGAERLNTPAGGEGRPTRRHGYTCRLKQRFGLAAAPTSRGRHEGASERLCLSPPVRSKDCVIS